MNSAPFKVDDKIQTRDGGLALATYDGAKWQGTLVRQGFTYAKGYKVFFSGAAGSVIRQSGEAQLPVEDVVLSKGWNWVGHAANHRSFNINSGIRPVSGQFTVNDQIKTRFGNYVTFSGYDGSQFQGSLSELEPGAGYEIRVAQAVTFRYATPADRRMLAAKGRRRMVTTNSGCTPHFATSSTLSDFPDTAAMLATVTLDGVQIGYPVDGTTKTTSCDQIAAIGVTDGIVRGTSTHVNLGFTLGIVGTAEEQIEFKYWSAAEEKEYHVPFQYKMVGGGQIGSFGALHELAL